MITLVFKSPIKAWVEMSTSAIISYNNPDFSEFGFFIVILSIVFPLLAKTPLIHYFITDIV